MIDWLEILSLPPFSHSTFTCFSAWFARHQLVATTATQSSATTTCFTPGIVSAAASSTLFTKPPNTGLCRIDACSMPGRRTSDA